MNVTGIIAEYNPFHNGHAFHIEETRKRTHADYCIAIMSGDFVQRGAPALVNKYTRAKMALKNGIDLVIELPTIAAVSSAEAFAQGGVCLLDALGVVSNISFGAEASNVSNQKLLGFLADFFSSEPPAFREQLDLALKNGCSFPTARAQAALHCLQQNTEITSDGTLQDLERLLASPNNILAIEYQKAILKHDCKLTPCIISRNGAGYHDADTDTQLPSASALRHFFLSKAASDSELSENAVSETLNRTVPASVADTLQAAWKNGQFLQENDFSDLLYYELRRQHLSPSELTEVGDNALSDLTRRAANHLEDFTCWTDFIADLKTKNQTYTAISRYLLHALLGINDELLAAAKSCHYAPYARILGFRRDAAPLLKELQTHSQIPLLRKIAKEQQMLTPAQQKLLNLDIYAADLYNRILYSRSGIRRRSDYREPLVIV